MMRPLSEKNCRCQKSCETFQVAVSKNGVAKHKIKLTPAAKPVYQAPYRADQRSKKIKEDEINCVQDAGVIEPTLAEPVSPAAFVPNKKGTVRFCVE